MSWKLRSTQPQVEPQEVEIQYDMLVGRHQQADLSLAFAEVSRRHAGIILKDDQLFVIDLESSNGTFVNGQQITEEVLLKANDLVRFAHVEYQVIYESSTVEQEKATTQHTDAAQQMNDQGMPSLAERAVDTNISREGMPQRVDVPKPAPIPEHVQLDSPPTSSPNMPSSSSDAQEEKKNASIGLISMMLLVIIAIIAWVVLK